MALERKYEEAFERLWRAYPKWPPGRSKKEVAHKAFLKAKKDLAFTTEDIDYITGNIEQRKRDCETWQKGSKFGPVGLAVYINQHLWNEPYPKAKPHWSQSQRPHIEKTAEPERPRASPEQVAKALAEAKRGLGGRIH